jgi:hypothetical protein
MKKKRKKEATTAETSRGSIVATRLNSEPTGELFVVVAMIVEDTPACAGHGIRRGFLRLLLRERPRLVFRDGARSRRARRCYDPTRRIAEET